MPATMSPQPNCGAHEASYSGDRGHGSTAEKVPGGGGLHIAVYEAGNPAGPPILFIHGFTGNYLTWERQFSGPLADEFRLVAYDLRGHGASDKPLTAEHYTSSDLWAEDLAAVIRAKDLDRPVLVGWSYGGYVMADYVRRFGQDDIGGLVFVGAATNAGTEEAQAFTETPLGDETFDVFLAGAMMVPPEVRLAVFSGLPAPARRAAASARRRTRPAPAPPAARPADRVARPASLPREREVVIEA